MIRTIDIKKPSEVHQSGTEALVKALGPIGMARYLEEYDNGGTGDYTKEKYDQPDFSVEEILDMKKR
ncbi:MAG: hypothetical protein IJ733_11790 [Lachnospiraceae bacterium]|nr:hypothetical protein [Lachnospiraceae bacterium]